MLFYHLPDCPPPRGPAAKEQCLIDCPLSRWVLYCARVYTAMRPSWPGATLLLSINSEIQTVWPPRWVGGRSLSYKHTAGGRDAYFIPRFSHSLKVHHQARLRSRACVSLVQDMCMWVCVCVRALSSCEIGFFSFCPSSYIFLFVRLVYIYIYIFGCLSPPSSCRVRIQCCAQHTFYPFFYNTPLPPPLPPVVRRINLRTERDLWLFINRGLLVPLRHSFPLFRCTCICTHTHTHTPVSVLLYTHTRAAAHLYIIIIIYTFVHIYIYKCRGVCILCVYVYMI